MMRELSIFFVCCLILGAVNAEKRGFPISESAPRDGAFQFNDTISWFYTGDMMPNQDWQVAWANDNDIEFVPMISSEMVFKSGRTDVCNLDVDNPRNLEIFDVTEECTQAMIEQALEEAIDDFDHIGYFMGFHHMGDEEDDLPALDAAMHWQQYIQPALATVAVTKGVTLKQVSPSSGMTAYSTEWLADFIKECWATRLWEIPCDIDEIEIFAIHEYRCMESYWNTNYVWDGAFRDNLHAHFEGYLDNVTSPVKTDSEWLTWIRAREFWVTETNCWWDDVPAGDPAHHWHSMEQCSFVTGSETATHGEGSFNNFADLVKVERYAVWTLWSEYNSPNHLVYFSGDLTPFGEAFKDHTYTCAWSGNIFNAFSKAHLGPDTNIDTCVGTNQVRFSHPAGNETTRYITYEFDAPATGYYDIEIGYFNSNVNDRHLAITDAQKTDRFRHGEFMMTGSHCSASTHSKMIQPHVVELDAGQNFLTFFKMDGYHAPSIVFVRVIDTAVTNTPP